MMITRSPEETTLLARNIAEKLEAGSVVALYGNLGAGKTTLAKGIISLLTDIPEDTITSPTFNYMNLYATKDQKVLCHFDLYRLKNADDFRLAGFEEYLGAPYITLLEWPERITDLLSFPHKKIVISVVDENTRSFSW